MSTRIRDVSIHEEHGEVVGLWQRLGYRDEHVVCFDRHLDLKPLAPGSKTAIEAAAPSDLAGLNRSLPLRESAGEYGLDDFWSAGPILGRVSEVTWVTPGRPEERQGWRTRLLGQLAYLPADPETIEETRFEEGRLTTRLCGLTLHIRTLRSLLERPPIADFRVDVDLDWLADPHTGIDHTPRELASILRDNAWHDRLDSVTYSIRSGFLTEEHRPFGPELASALDVRLRAVDVPARETVPARTFAALRSRTPLGARDIRELAETELAALGALGAALHGLLWLLCEGDVAAAEDQWGKAETLGVRSTWLAFQLGLRRFQERRYAQAAVWFERAQGRLVDTLEARAAFLRLLCLIRLSTWDSAYPLASLLADRYPLHLDILRAASVVFKAHGSTEEAADLSARIERVTQVFGLADGNSTLIASKGAS